MASPHPSVTSLHNSPQTPQTPADYPHILPDSLMDFALDFAHLETGQYQNSPNAWKLTSKIAPWPETYGGKKVWGKKNHWMTLRNVTYRNRGPKQKNVAYISKVSKVHKI